VTLLDDITSYLDDEHEEVDDLEELDDDDHPSLSAAERNPSLR
jgi:hypothetical protein